MHGGLIGGMSIHRKDETHRLKNVPFELPRRTGVVGFNEGEGNRDHFWEAVVWRGLEYWSVRLGWFEDSQDRERRRR